MTEFYTYRIKWTSTNMSYYGVRYKRGETRENLFTTYFTSSKYVKEYIKTHGLPDVVEVRRTFDSAIKAKQWEERIIDRCQLHKNPNWLNKGNNGSFKNIVMDDAMRKKISDAKKKNARPGGKIYNNGTIEKMFYPTDIIPEGFVHGLLMTENRLKHNKKLNSQSQETRKQAAKKTGDKTRGRAKPEGFGEKISKANKGKPKPYMLGENNVSKTPEARAKISKSWETREPIRWFYNNTTKDMMWVYLKDISTVDTTVWSNGKPPQGEWYNDTINNIYVRYDDTNTDVNSLIRGKIKIHKPWFTNGTISSQFSNSNNVPEGWYPGRHKLEQQSQQPQANIKLDFEE